MEAFLAYAMPIVAGVAANAGYFSLAAALGVTAAILVVRVLCAARHEP